MQGWWSNMTSDYAALSMAASWQQIRTHFQQDFTALNL